jgi:hypothetical protein
MADTSMRWAVRLSDDTAGNSAIGVDANDQLVDQLQAD